MTRRGSAPKPSRILDELEVTYSESHWKLLAEMRESAMRVLDALGSWRSSAFVHGSLARGDVDAKSDIDIILPVSVNTQTIEADLELSGFSPASREITQATPMHAPKARIILDEKQQVAVTIPLSKLRTLEEQFYTYGGTAFLHELQVGLRKRGCTKRLTLIEPTQGGHKEWSVVGRESEAASTLGIKPDIVRERIRVLSRRNEVGRTGIFLTLAVPPGISFEDSLQQELRNNPALRRTLRTRR